MNTTTILFWLAAVCFAIDALRQIIAPSAKINFTAAGFCLLTIALWLV